MPRIFDNIEAASCRPWSKRCTWLSGLIYVSAISPCEDGRNSTPTWRVGRGTCRLLVRMQQIDRVLAQHYGFTDDELDFILNYDIKYCLGLDGGQEDET